MLLQLNGLQIGRLLNYIVKSLDSFPVQMHLSMDTFLIGWMIFKLVGLKFGCFQLDGLKFDIFIIEWIEVRVFFPIEWIEV